MKWKRSLGHCRRFIITHYGCHFSFSFIIFACAVAFLASPTVGGDTKTEQVERNGCHKITELRDLTLALADISDWTNLGYWLSVPHQIIQTIETDEKGTENKRRAVLRAWYNLQDHDPCWQSVTDALRQLDQNRLATRIDRCIHSIQSGTDCTLAICMKNGVDKCTHTYNSIITTDAIMTTVFVLLALCCCYFNHRSPQQEYKVKTTASPPSANGIEDTKETQQWTMENIPDETESQKEYRGIYSKVNTDPPLPEQFQHFEVDEDELMVQTHDIQGAFLVLFTQIQDYLNSKGVTVKQFLNFLKKVPGYSRRSLFDVSNFNEASDLTDVFDIVSDRCSWFNHSLIGFIVDGYCKDNEEMKEAYQKYHTLFQEYCNNRVIKCPFKNGFGNGRKEDKELVMKVDRKWEDIRIEELEEVVFNLARILKVSRHTLHLCSVENGCVQLTLLVPNNIPDAVFPLTTEQREAMREIGVIELQCGAYHFSCQPSVLTSQSMMSEQITDVPFDQDFDLWDPHMLPVDRHWYSASSSSGYASLESSISSDFWNEACEDDEMDEAMQSIDEFKTAHSPNQNEVPPMRRDQIVEHNGPETAIEEILDRDVEQLKMPAECDQGQKLTVSGDIFSLPLYIQVIVSHYQLLQRVFALPKGEECHTKMDEQFSPTLTVVDSETRRFLDCILLLHGEKPPEVNCRTLFFYIAVQVHGSYPHSLYHMESKPCKQGKLPLVFCFHQPGTVCVIQLSLHSIVDSEGIEYMHNSEDFTCVVQIIDRNQHGGVKMRNRHGVVMVKEPPPLRYTGPLATIKCHMLEMKFIQFFQTANHKHMQKLCELVVAKSSSSPDIKVLALCWEASSMVVQGIYKHAEQLLRTAWKKASKLECQNGLLLQGKVLRLLAQLQHFYGCDDKALEYISGAKERLFNAEPSNETASTLHAELVFKRRRCASFSQLYHPTTERVYEILLEHAKYMEEYEKGAICSFLAMKASFHLRSDMITDELPPKVYWPSPDDLRKARECLNSVSLDMMQNQSNFYTAQYYRTLCDLLMWRQQYPEAMYLLQKARNIGNKLNVTVHSLEQRLKLLQKLKDNDKNDETLMELLI